MFSLSLALAILLPAADTADAEFERVRRVAPVEPVEELPAGKTKVGEWVLGPARQRDLKPVEAERVLRSGAMHFVKQKGTGRWLVGNVNDPKAGSVECDQQFASLDALIDAAKFAPLPKPPAGFKLREVCKLPTHPTRLAGDGQGKRLFVLCGNGDVWRVDLPDGKPVPVLRGHDYIDPARGERSTYGLVLDKQNRLYIVCNQRVDKLQPITNEVTIFRTTTQTPDGDPSVPKPWLRTSYPWGIGPFNHGVGHIAFGPDGYLYVNSGSRTDGNERSKDPRYSSEGETPLTACIWRLDPKADDQPTIELYARGLRNAYSFGWTDKGEMFATENGPDADPPEELNHILPGRHYGFPYQFSDWTKKPYPYTPDAPKGLEFVPPVRNLGPAAGGSPDKPLSTFDAHSSPLGFVWLGDDFPESVRGTFLVARFGNLLERPKDVGFDVLNVRLEGLPSSGYSARCTTLLDGVSRPVDLHQSGKGRIFICEYSRQTANKGYGGMLPGRILELSAGQ
jgi:hypothetical protein